MNKNPKFNWFPFVFIAIVVLIVLLSCNSVNKARGKTETLTIYEYDTMRVSVVDTTRTLQEWIEFQTKTVELFDTTYTTVPILRKRIIYENVKASSKEVAMGVSRDSVKATGSVTAFSQSDYRNKETKRLPFWLALSIVAVISFVIYKLWREK
jgi:ABC-type thiamine transport system substrate-binding protein